MATIYEVNHQVPGNRRNARGVSRHHKGQAVRKICPPSRFDSNHPHGLVLSAHSELTFFEFAHVLVHSDGSSTLFLG
jgi:hypothetical protein